MGVQVPPSAPNLPPESSPAPSEVLQSIVIVLVTIIHVLVCLLLIVIILLQQGKSADLAAAFGGQGSQTAFGPRSAANLLTKTTTWLAVIFILTSVTLTVLEQHQTTHHRSVLSGSTTAHSTPKTK
jgi:preprotein translocase subunit SecG